jgi:hypothetical protein
VLKETGWGFYVVGPADNVKDALGLPVEPHAMGWVPFADYPEAMAQTTVGIVPLADTDFNRAKSSLKMMEYASLGVPVLASPSADNVRMHEAGVGELVKKPHHWYKLLKNMVTNQGYRDDVAGRGRVAMKDYTYSNQSWRWADVWGLK